MTLPFQSFIHDRLPSLRRTAIADRDDGLPSDDAELIEAAREKLLLDSDEIRLGHDADPRRTARVLAETALFFMDSAAPAFEKAITLNETQANLSAAGLHGRSARQIARLSLISLPAAFPEVKNDTFTNDLNQAEIRARLDAIENTTPTMPFPQALEQAWELQGQPIDPLILDTEEKVLASLRANRSKQLETAATGAFDPFADDDE